MRLLNAAFDAMIVVTPGYDVDDMAGERGLSREVPNDDVRFLYGGQEAPTMTRNRLRLQTIALALVMFNPATAFGQECYDLEENPVRVIAHKFAGFPPAYAFRIDNGSENPVGVIDVGAGYGWFLSGEASLPHRVSAPAGWQGIRLTCPADDCGDIRYRWIADDGNELRPGESLMGFSVQFSHISDTGSSVRPETLTRVESPWDLRVMPFQAFGPGFSSPCYVGVVEESMRAPLAENAMRPPAHIIDFEAASARETAQGAETVPD